VSRADRDHPGLFVVGPEENRGLAGLFVGLLMVIVVSFLQVDGDVESNGGGSAKNGAICGFKQTMSSSLPH
jgi:hypothetical protein